MRFEPRPNYYSLRAAGDTRPVGSFRVAESLAKSAQFGQLLQAVLKPYGIENVDTKVSSRISQVKVMEHGRPSKPFEPPIRYFLIDEQGVLGEEVPKVKSVLVDAQGHPVRVERVGNENYYFSQNGRGPDPVSSDEVRKQKFDPEGRAVQEVKTHEKLMAEAAEVVAIYTHDLMDSDGTVKPDNQKVFDHLIKLTPKIVGILLDQQNYVDSIEKSQFLNVLAAALHTVRNPNSQINLNIGIGGTNAEAIADGINAYGIHALKTAVALKELFDQERTQVLGEQGVRRNELSYEDYRQTLIDAHVPINDPFVRFLLTPEAAIHVNYPDQARRVRENAATIINILSKFVSETIPLDINVAFGTDIPWDQHSPETKYTLRYGEHLLEEAQEPGIRKTVETLRAIGEKYGGAEGAAKATIYMAMHGPALFDQWGDLRPVAYWSNPDSLTPPDPSASLIEISSGCNREGLFNDGRRYLVAHASASDRLRWLRQQLATETDSTKLSEMRQALVSFEREAQTREDLTADHPLSERINYVPIFTTHALNRGKPPYYSNGSVDQAHHETFASPGVLQARILELYEELQRVREAKGDERQIAYKLADYEAIAGMYESVRVVTGSL